MARIEIFTPGVSGDSVTARLQAAGFAPDEQRTAKDGATVIVVADSVEEVTAALGVLALKPGVRFRLGED